MSSVNCGPETVSEFSRPQRVERYPIEPKRYEALLAELQASRAREDALREDRDRQEILGQEYEHRINNGLQLIASLLSVQSRATQIMDTRVQLGIAARRVVALGTVHRRLNPLDQPVNVEFKQLLIDLCDDLSNLLFQSRTDHAILVEGTKLQIPSSLARSLGLITSELITNSVKYANSDITVRLERVEGTAYSLSVQDSGPGLPIDFDPFRSKGCGMKIISSLIKQIDGKLQIANGEGNRGMRCTVTFGVSK